MRTDHLVAMVMSWRRVEQRMKTRGEKMVRTGDCCVCVLRCDHPLDSAGLFSFMTFNWLTPLAVRACRKCQLLLDRSCVLLCPGGHRERQEETGGNRR